MHSPESELTYFINWTKTTYKDKTFQWSFFQWQVSFIMKRWARKRWVPVIWEFGMSEEHVSTVSQKQHHAKKNNSQEHLLTARFQAKAAGLLTPLFPLVWLGKAAVRLQSMRHLQLSEHYQGLHLWCSSLLNPELSQVTWASLVKSQTYRYLSETHDLAGLLHRLNFLNKSQEVSLLPLGAYKVETSQIHRKSKAEPENTSLSSYFLIHLTW